MTSPIAAALQPIGPAFRRARIVAVVGLVLGLAVPALPAAAGTAQPVPPPSGSVGPKTPSPAARPKLSPTKIGPAKVSASTTLAPSKTDPATTSAPINQTPFPTFDQPYLNTLRAVAADLDSWWSEEMPRVYRKSFSPLKGYFAYTASSLPPSCGGRQSPTYEDIAENAFYCRGADYIAWDDQTLFPEIYKAFGEVGLATVIAHEMGHAIQARTSTRLASVYAELQADCFSGAWLAHVRTNKNPSVTFSADALDNAVQAILAFRDQPGIGAGTPGAHGNGFDRVNAFQIGFEEGNTRCAAFTTAPPIVTARDFAVGEADNGGNVPIAEAVTITIASANKHFVTLFPGFPTITRVNIVDAAGLDAAKACAGSVSMGENFVVVCPSDTDGAPTVAIDATRLQRLYRVSGDFGVSFGLVLGWSALAQQRLGLTAGGASTASELQAECIAGSWVGAINAGQLGASSLSPGDLDEALMTLTRLPGKAGSFERVRAMRNGFTNGAAPCLKAVV